MKAQEIWTLNQIGIAASDPDCCALMVSSFFANPIDCLKLGTKLIAAKLGGHALFTKKKWRKFLSKKRNLHV